jgi:protein O-GlcNAc transferase
VKKPKVSRSPKALGFGKRASSDRQIIDEKAVHFFNQGIALLREGSRAKAADYFAQAALHQPDWAEAYFNQGFALSAPWMGCLGAAVACYRRALTLKPDWAEAHCNLAELLAMIGDSSATIASCQNALTLRPNYAEAHQLLLFARQYSANLEPEEWRSTLTNFARSCFSQSIPAVHSNPCEPDRRLRIGYVSPDFRTHSCAWFFEPLLTHHDREQFEIFCYPSSSFTDTVTARLRSLADGWHSIAGRIDGSAELIRSHHIDILVDLSGYSFGNALSVFHQKPAPVQVTWLGCPGSTGLDAIDYRLSDPWLTPPGTPEFFTEAIWNLERPSHCYRPSFDAPTIALLPAEQKGYVTFGSFNNLSKVNSETISLWACVLRAVGNSRLILKGSQTNDPEIRRRLSNGFGECGIDIDRIEFLGAVPSLVGHLDCYNNIDIALDTFPYNGATTTCEALWMGVPVVSLRSWRTASRYGLSLLQAVGLEELAVDSPKAYIQVAIELAGNLGRLAGLRAGLRKHMEQSSLRDEAGFARTVENAYQQMWQHWCVGQTK